MAVLQAPLTTVSAVTTSTTLVSGKHTPVDATSGALTQTLPTPTVVGERLRVEKVDSSANYVTVAGTLRGSASTITIRGQYQLLEFVAESLTSWRVGAGHIPFSLLDASYIGVNDTRLSTITANTQTGAAYTLALSDAGKVIEMNSTGANTVTIPTNATVAFPVGTVIEIDQIGAGQTSLQGATGVTLLYPNTLGTKIAGQYQAASIRQRSVDVWLVGGGITA